MQHTDGKPLPAFGTDIPMLQAFLRLEAHVAFAMTVHVVFAFFREELVRAQESFFGFQRVEQAIVASLGIEQVSLSS